MPSPGKFSSRANLKPLKKYGQHFLKDQDLARKIVEQVQISENDTVLEIGPGNGVLTQYLILSPARRIIAVEVDERLYNTLKEKYWEIKHLELLAFLKVHCSREFKIGQRLRNWPN